MLSLFVPLVPCSQCWEADRLPLNLEVAHDY